MNHQKQALEALDLTAYGKEWCCVCGRPAGHRHHLAYRSHGGVGTVSLCADCHRREHAHRLAFLAKEGELYVCVVTGEGMQQFPLRPRADGYRRLYEGGAR
jgi:hypothetical protein